MQQASSNGKVFNILIIESGESAGQDLLRIKRELPDLRPKFDFSLTFSSSITTGVAATKSKNFDLIVIKDVSTSVYENSFQQNACNMSYLRRYHQGGIGFKLKNLPIVLLVDQQKFVFKNHYLHQHHQFYIQQSLETGYFDVLAHPLQASLVVNLLTRVNEHNIDLKTEELLMKMYADVEICRPIQQSDCILFQETAAREGASSPLVESSIPLQGMHSAALLSGFGDERRADAVHASLGIGSIDTFDALMSDPCSSSCITKDAHDSGISKDHNI